MASPLRSLPYRECSASEHIGIEMKRPTNRPGATLRKAPLAEAVFELRWALHGPPELPSVFHIDPGYLLAEETFRAKVADLGFTVAKEMTAPGEVAAGYSIGKRYYQASEQNFPLLQLGPGIFASNQSTEYNWTGFKEQAMLGIEVLLDSYPSLGAYSLRPNYVELRYIDAFDSSLVGTIDLVDFLATGTKLEMKVPDLLRDKDVFADLFQGRLLLQRALKGWKSSQFISDLGSAQRDKEKVIRLETKVVTTDEGVPTLTGENSFPDQVEEWLEFAHGLTSPYFKQIVSETAMDKFNEVS
jgi:uncharacterized protein (TIGR04255 family)